MTDFGYDVSDYRGVDPSFGTLVDFRRLLTEAFTKHFYYRKFVDSEQMVSLVMEEPSSK